MTDEAAPATKPDPEQLEKALGSTTRSLQRLVRRLRDEDLGENLAEEVERAQRRLRVNRKLLGLPGAGRGRGAGGGGGRRGASPPKGRSAA